MQCLEKKPADRPQSAEEVLRQLDQVLTPSGGMTPTDTRPYQTAGMRRAKRRQLLIGTAVVAGLAVIGVLGWRGWHGRAEPIVADRVLVAPLEAEGAAFEGLARDLAALPTALTREGIGKPVAAATVRDLVAGSRADPAKRAQFLAKRTGAAYVLRTSCEPQGAGADCQLELFEEPGNRLRMAVPVQGTAIDSAFSARVQEQALAMLLLEFYWGDETTWLGEYITPSLEAVRAFNLATQGNNIYSDSLVGQVVRADSNWILPVSSWLGSGGLSDSALDAMFRRPGLTERDRLLNEVRRGWSYNDPERQFEVFRQLYRGWPSFWVTMYGRLAVATHRPQLALDAYAREDSVRSRRKQPPREHSPSATIALHHLGRYREQLTVARAVREAPAEVYGSDAGYRAGLWQALEIQGYAGLGDVDGVRRVVADLETRSWRDWPWLLEEQTEDLGLAAALELMAHGRVAEGQAMLSSSLPAMRRRREEAQDFSLAENEVWALEWTGQLEEAERLAKTALGLADRFLGVEVRAWAPEMLGSLGKIAARQGRREEALTYSRQLADSAAHYLNVRDLLLSLITPSSVRARYIFYQATIAARLGDKEEAVRLLKEARRAYADLVPGHFQWMHIDPDLASLRGSPPFEALLAPKD
jgi:tetratricopeptide (TPR) repeat protein